MIEKKELRALLAQERDEIDSARAQDWSERIARRVLRLPEYERAERILCYVSARSEVGTRALMNEILRSGRALYLPRMCGRGVMEAARLYDPNALVKNRYQIEEPIGLETGKSSEMDLILTPGLAFDRYGARLGYGAGYYDRYLPDCRGLIAALAFEAQMRKTLPVEAHDVLMDRIITERAVYDCAANRISAAASKA